MIDSKTVRQEVQKELLAALQRGHEQVRKGQDRVRQGQEQMRRGRDAVAGVVRAGGELAKAVRPSVPARPVVHVPSPAQLRAHAQELVTAQRDLAGKAREAATPYTERLVAVRRDLADRARQAGVAEQVAAAQRTLAGRVVEVAKVATPFVAEGRARLTQVVSALQSGHQGAHAPEETADQVMVTPDAAVAPAAEPAAEATEPAAAKPAAAKAESAAAKPAAAKAAKPKARPTKSTAARPTSSAKPRSSAKK
ncbi:MAG TPA: hypothetical protein VEJ42_10405 [Streptosporangiaceae bacterium]|nr:hypothetical protein [Streptosporangiaceae bacterium]